MRITSMAVAALALCAGAAQAQIADGETYEIFTLLGSDPNDGTGLALTAFIDNVPDEHVIGGAPEFAGLDLFGGTNAYFVDDAVFDNGDGTFDLVISMFAVDAATGTSFVPFVPAGQAGDSIFVQLGGTGFGGSGDGVFVPGLDGSSVSVGLSLIDLTGANVSFAPDYAPGLFELTEDGDTELFTTIDFEANDGAIDGDSIAGFNIVLTFVPAPGAATLFGAAAFVGVRRRRA